MWFRFARKSSDSYLQLDQEGLDCIYSEPSVDSGRQLTSTWSLSKTGHVARLIRTWTRTPRRIGTPAIYQQYWPPSVGCISGLSLVSATTAATRRTAETYQSHYMDCRDASSLSTDRRAWDNCRRRSNTCSLRRCTSVDVRTRSANATLGRTGLNRDRQCIVRHNGHAVLWHEFLRVSHQHTHFLKA